MWLKNWAMGIIVCDLPQDSWCTCTVVKASSSDTESSLFKFLEPLGISSSFTVSIMGVVSPLWLSVNKYEYTIKDVSLNMDYPEAQQNNLEKSLRGITKVCITTGSNLRYSEFFMEKTTRIGSIKYKIRILYFQNSWKFHKIWKLNYMNISLILLQNFYKITLKSSQNVHKIIPKFLKNFLEVFSKCT